MVAETVQHSHATRVQNIQCFHSSLLHADRFYKERHADECEIQTDFPNFFNEQKK